MTVYIAAHAQCDHKDVYDVSDEGWLGHLLAEDIFNRADTEGE